MEYKRFGDTIIMRLDKSDEITESLVAVAAAENIKAASFHGIGATDSFEVGVFDLDKQDYNRFSFTGNHEITSLEGNISFFENKPYIHAHITCGNKDGNIVGGHLFRGVISLTGEIFINIVDGEVGRKFNPEIGINRLDF
jgi:predicted DNA-binding protein with PD1-like motif